MPLYAAAAAHSTENDYAYFSEDIFAGFRHMSYDTIMLEPARRRRHAAIILPLLVFIAAMPIWRQLSRRRQRDAADITYAVIIFRCSD